MVANPTISIAPCCVYRGGRTVLVGKGGSVKTTTIMVAGATGLVGASFVAIAEGKPDLATISLVRGKARQNQVAIDFEALVADPAATLQNAVPFRPDVAVCCLGTMLSVAGSKEAMWRVDHDFVVAFAKGARALGVKRLILMSAAGAGGTGFYLKTKAAVEAEIKALGFARVDFLRPGLVLGPRPNRSLGAAIGAAIYPYLAPLFPGPLAKFRSIDVKEVAGAMVKLSRYEAPGLFIHHNKELSQMTRTV